MTGPVIPIRAAGGPDRGWLGAEDWARGSTFLEFVDAASTQRAVIEAAFRRTAPAPEDVVAAEGVRRTLRIVAFVAAGDLEAATNIAHAERFFATGSNLWLRVFDPVSAADLVERFLPEVSSASSHLAFFAEDGRACARWGPRPARLQAKYDAEPAAKHAALRETFYAVSDGREQAREWGAILRTCGGS